MMIGTVLCLAFASPLMALFTENIRTVVIGAHALRIICVGFLVSAVSVTASGALEGLGKGTASLVISLCRYTVVILPIAVVLCRDYGREWRLACVLGDGVYLGRSCIDRLEASVTALTPRPRRWARG